MNNKNLHKDFYKIENMKFDISKLQGALHEVLKIKKYDTAGGISHFGAICLNQIPGQPDSIKGNKARGIFWTKPDHTGKEAKRDTAINESKYKLFSTEKFLNIFSKIFINKSLNKAIFFSIIEKPAAIL